MDALVYEYEWNDSTLDLQFQSPGTHKPQQDATSVCVYLYVDAFHVPQTGAPSSKASSRPGLVCRGCTVMSRPQHGEYELFQCMYEFRDSLSTSWQVFTPSGPHPWLATSKHPGASPPPTCTPTLPHSSHYHQAHLHLPPAATECSKSSPFCKHYCTVYQGKNCTHACMCV